jgi:hypothetical protein
MTDRLPAVKPSSGLPSVLAGTTWILAQATSSSSAAIWPSAVTIP